MADSILSITIRDSNHPCAPYQSTPHSFRVEIYHCDGTPLFWKGVNYGATGVWLDTRGAKRGFIHAQVKVPPGCYLVRAHAKCKNVVSDWAYVGVGCDQTVCVNLVIPTLLHCVLRTITGLLLSTVDPPEGEEMVVKIMPREVKEAVKALNKVADKLPKDLQLPVPPTKKEIEKIAKEPKLKSKRKSLK